MTRKSAYLVAVSSFGVKGVCAFAITYLLANSLRAPEFALWATIFSFGTILSVADLGVGQLILTTFYERQGQDTADDRLVTNAVAAMIILSVIMLLLISLVFWTQHIFDTVRWRELVIASILLRLILIPYGAFLSAHERYHERKVAEAASYALAAVFILWGVRSQAGFSTLLLGMNVIITVSSLSVVVRAKQLGMARVKVHAIIPAEIRRVFADAFPYFVNNVSGLAVYGGFIALSSLILGALELARLSLLHNLLLMHLFQVFDLIFRSVQPRMNDRTVMRKLSALLALSYGLALAAAPLVGVWLFARFFHKYRFTPAELAIYTTFAFLEVYYLMLSSAMQMRSAMRKQLQWMGLAKAVVFGLVLLVASVSSHALSLLEYSALLVLYSAMMGYMAWKFAGQPMGLQLQVVRD